MTKPQPCKMCFNARLDDGLTDDNDLSYFGVGTSYKGHRIMVASGNGRPLRIIVDCFDGGLWHEVAKYYPKYCPNCGREITEYVKGHKELQG